MDRADPTQTEAAEPNQAGPSGTPAPADPDRVTRRELAERLGVHMMTVTRMERDGMPIAQRGGRGVPSYYSERDCREWKAHREKRTADKQTISLADARIQREISQARLNEQKHAIQAGELIPAEDVEKVWSREFAAIRTFLLSSVTTHADQILRAATLDGIDGVERELEALATEALNGIGEGKHVEPPAKPKRKKKAA